MLECLQAVPELKVRFPQVFAWLEGIFAQSGSATRLAVAVSGGSDSQLLACILATFREENNWNPDQLFFWHCNHKVRKASDDEQKSMQQRYAGRNLRILERSVQDWEVITEKSLRGWRYGAFLQVMEENDIQHLALGHHLNDRIEGSLLNLARGCGLNGLIGMQMQEPHHLLQGREVSRPLLEISKEEILTACRELGIPFWEDASNHDSSVSLRNQLRNQILLPLLELGKGKFLASWQGIYQELEQISTQTCAQMPLLDPLKVSPYRNCDQAYRISAKNQTGMSLSQLARIATQLQIPMVQGEMQSLLDWMLQGKEGFRYWRGWTRMLAHGEGYLFATEERFWEQELLEEREIFEAGRQTFGAFTLEISEELVGAKLRFPRAGDQFHGKSLKKWALNQKIPRFWRHALPLAHKAQKIIKVWKPNELIFKI